MALSPSNSNHNKTINRIFLPSLPPAKQHGRVQHHQVPADDGSGDEEDRGQQHPGVPDPPARQQEPRQGRGQEAVRHQGLQDQHPGATGRQEEGLRAASPRLRRAGHCQQDRYHLRSQQRRVLCVFPLFFYA